MSRYVWLSVLFIITASLGTIWMFHNTAQQQALQPQQNLRPDAFMVNANYYEYDDQGLLHSHLFTPKVTHYPEKNSAQFQHPSFMIYADKKRIPWYITADHGQSRSGIDTVYLWDHVHLHQPPQENNLGTDITTDRMTVLPNQSIAKTDQPVTITRPDSIIKATGMQTDFKTGIVKLLSHSRGIYAATPANQPVHFSDR